MLNDQFIRLPRHRRTPTTPPRAPGNRGSGPDRARFSVSGAVTLAAATALLTGCAVESGGGRVATVDSAGVQIVQNPRADSGEVTWWTLAAEPRLDVGAVEGTESEVLFRVVDAVLLSDGRVAIANAGSSQIRYYAADGTNLVTSGRQGSGPGEFRQITGLLPMPGDSMAVLDGGLRRVTVLAPDGKLSREVLGAPGERFSVMGRRENGTWVAQSNTVLQNQGIKQGLVRPTVVYVTLPPGGGPAIDTLGHFPGAERVMRIGESGGNITSIDIMTPPFAKTTTFVTQGNDLVVGTQDAAELRVYDSHGALRRIVRTGTAPQRLTPELIEEYMSRRLARVPVERRQAMRDRELAILTAELVPPYGTIALDRSGNLWAQDYPGLTDDQRWTIYDAHGARIARITLPGLFTPYDIGEDWILGRELDDLDVEHVRLYDVRRSAASR